MGNMVYRWDGWGGSMGNMVYRWEVGVEVWVTWCTGGRLGWKYG